MQTGPNSKYLDFSAGAILGDALFILIFQAIENISPFGAEWFHKLLLGAQSLFKVCHFDEKATWYKSWKKKNLWKAQVVEGSFVIHPGLLDE